MVGTCSLRFSRKLDNMLPGLLLRSEGAWYDCRTCEETSLSSHLLVCYRMWWIRWQILGVADGATTQWHTYVIKNRMKRHWTISRQQNSLYFCVGSSRMREWSDDSPRARAHVYEARAPTYAFVKISCGDHKKPNLRGKNRLFCSPNNTQTTTQWLANNTLHNFGEICAIF